jgi:hypothetical protein
MVRCLVSGYLQDRTSFTCREMCNHETNEDVVVLLSGLETQNTNLPVLERTVCAWCSCWNNILIIGGGLSE